jgi:hypothetical protein
LGTRAREATFSFEYLEHPLGAFDVFSIPSCLEVAGFWDRCPRAVTFQPTHRGDPYSAASEAREDVAHVACERVRRRDNENVGRRELVGVPVKQDRDTVEADDGLARPRTSLDDGRLGRRQLHQLELNTLDRCDDLGQLATGAVEQAPARSVAKQPAQRHRQH